MYYCIWCRKFHHRGKTFWEHMKYEFKTKEKLQQREWLDDRQRDLVNRHLEEISAFPEDLKKYMLNSRNRLTIEEAREVARFPPGDTAEGGNQADRKL